ncbi:TrbC/VirB2 family protein [Metabacillus indicus]|uniref:TrbC/VirB2 family protein n=1 Tax=Metabacillus indicus TaxID=246786 RepID=UPI002A0007E1|nr:TrbC/VirB2 family protein [Metabacillus indicus]MDX8288816.1 TrbC/VirB2 family protein [Metabacillus indicus]
MAKIQTVGTVQEFMSGEWKVSKKEKVAFTSLASMSLYPLFLSKPAAAGAVTGVITEKTVNAFDPIVHLVQGLSYPIGLIVMMCGGIVWMIGNKEKGLTLITNAGLGYIIVQMVPLGMKLLVEVAKTF